MSILKSIIDSIRASVSNEAFDQMQAREMHGKVVEAIREASSDGTITADEIVAIKELMNDLQISDVEMNSIKLDVLKNLIQQILADHKVTENEMKLFQEVEDGLNFAEGDKAQLQADIDKVKSLFEQK